MKSIPINFFIKLLFFLGITFSSHLLVLHLLHLPLYDNLIILAYVVNFILAYGTFMVLFLLKKKFASSLGFLFMGGSLLKFIVFFIVFNPVYKADEIMSKLELTSFFIPYAISLFIEVFFFVKLLKAE